MEEIQRSFRTSYLRLIAGDRRLIGAIETVCQYLQPSGNRTLYIRSASQYKALIVGRLVKLAIAAQKLGTFERIVILTDDGYRIYPIDALIACCPKMVMADGPYDKALQQEEFMRLVD